MDLDFYHRLMMIYTPLHRPVHGLPSSLGLDISRTPDITVEVIPPPMCKVKGLKSATSRMKPCESLMGTPPSTNFGMIVLLIIWPGPTLIGKHCSKSSRSVQIQSANNGLRANGFMEQMDGHCQRNSRHSFALGFPMHSTDAGLSWLAVHLNPGMDLKYGASSTKSTMEAPRQYSSEACVASKSGRNAPL